MLIYEVLQVKNVHQLVAWQFEITKTKERERKKAEKIGTVNEVK